MKSKVVSLLILFAFLFSLSYVLADVPRMINYQGKITTPTGALVDTTVQMIFTIYDSPSDGGVLWADTQSTVVVVKGVFSVLLGSGSPIPDSVFDGNIRYLGVKTGDDPEMIPRKQIVSVAYAYHSAIADSALNVVSEEEGLTSVDGVSNPGGDVDLIQTDAIIIIPDDLTNTITIGETHSGRTDNPHSVTALQVGALLSVDGVSNEGGDVDFIQQNAVTIAANDATNTITIGENHSARTDNPHSVTTFQTGAFASVDGVSNAGGDLDLIQQNAIVITPNDESNTVTIGENHSARTDNPHQVTAVQTGALVSLDGVDNAGGNVDLVAGANMTITPDSEAKTITFSAAGGGGGGWVDDGTIVRLGTDTDSVGIGTSSPGTNLSIFGGSNAQVNDLLRVDSPSGNEGTAQRISFGMGGWIQDIQYVSNRGAIQIGDSSNVRLQIDTRGPQAGNIGIGTTDPVDPIHVEGDYPRIRISGTESEGRPYLLEEWEGVFRIRTFISGWQTKFWLGKDYNASIAGTLSVGPVVRINGITNYSSYSPFYGAEIPLSLRYNSYGPFQKLIVLRNADDDYIGEGLRRLGIAFHFAGESDLTEASKMGAITVETSNPFSNRPQMHFWTYGNQRMIITYNGKVGIGTTDPSQELDVVGDLVATGPSDGAYLGLFKSLGSLPGYPDYRYPTIKTDYQNMYFSVGGQYSAYVNAAGTWTAMSSRDAKENFVPVNPQEILSKLEQLPITRWNFKTEDSSIKHIAPIAEDFHALFGLNGQNNRMISHIDPSGVALAGLKALLQEVKKQQQEIQELHQEIEELKLLLSNK